MAGRAGGWVTAHSHRPKAWPGPCPFLLLRFPSSGAEGTQAGRAAAQPPPPAEQALPWRSREATSSGVTIASTGLRASVLGSRPRPHRSRGAGCAVLYKSFPPRKWRPRTSAPGGSGRGRGLLATTLWLGSPGHAGAPGASGSWWGPGLHPLWRLRPVCLGQKAWGRARAASMGHRPCQQAPQASPGPGRLVCRVGRAGGWGARDNPGPRGGHWPLLLPEAQSGTEPGAHGCDLLVPFHTTGQRPAAGSGPRPTELLAPTPGLGSALQRCPAPAAWGLSAWESDGAAFGSSRCHRPCT